MPTEVLVIGGDTNGLTAACFLAKEGRSVTLLTQGAIGGLTARHEFHPGYHSPGVLCDTSMLRRWVVDKLELEQHGLRFDGRGAVLAMGDDQHIELSNDRTATIESVGRVSKTDGESYRRFCEFIDRVKAPLERLLNSMPADVVDPSFTDLRGLASRGFQLRRLGKKLMLEVLRLGPLAVYDWMDEWFESDLLKAAIALPAVIESYTAPWSAGTNANLLMRHVTKGNDVAGDGLALVSALEGAARNFGVEVRPATVASIRPGFGVDTTDGETIEAETIVTSLDPKTVFLELMGPGLLDHRFEQRILNYRARGLRSQLLLALDRPPELPLDSTASHLRIIGSLDEIERSFDPIKYGRYAEHATLEVYLPSVTHEDLAPAGHAVASVNIHYTPYFLEGGWTDAARERLTRLTIETLEARLPGIAESVVGHELLTPPDIEERYGVSGGHVFQGEHALDQLLVRPVPECSQYATPFEGLYLCGGGSFPGGGLTCTPGALAARAVLSRSN